MRQPHDWTRARSAANLTADAAAIRATVGDIEAAAALWAELDALSRWPSASSFIRQRATTAAAALGVIIDHAMTAPEART